MKRITVSIIAVLIIGGLFHLFGENKPVTPTDDPIVRLINQKKWGQLSHLFLDDSHKVLKKNFGRCKRIVIQPYKKNQLTFYAKHASEGEIGTILFEIKDGKYSNLEIKNQVKPFYYIEKYKKYRVKKLKLTIGDATLKFSQGHFYQAIPHKSLLFFSGKWEITITPNDDEEVLTLKRKYGSNQFSKSNENGIIVPANVDFLAKLHSQGEVTTLAENLKEMHDYFCDMYGMTIAQINEPWFLPFPDQSNVVLFDIDKRDPDNFYYYSYNGNLVPDTQLTTTKDHDLILSYNSIKKMKFFFGKPNNPTDLKLNLFFKPATDFISGTTTITYKYPTYSRELQLAPKIQIVSNLDPNTKGMNLMRKRGKYFLMGPESKTLSLFFKGRIIPTEANLDLFASETPNSPKRKERQPEDFYFLSRAENFYPNPGDHFVKSEATINLPKAVNCLASGSFRGKTVTETGGSVFRFDCLGAKGVSMVTGAFEEAKKLDSKTPVRIYTFDSFKYPKDLKFDEIKDGVDFFIQSFGPLGVTDINILLKRGLQEGGLSNPGFIVLNMPPHFTQKLLSGLPVGQTVISPITTRDRFEDHILHEIAHQWWGGLLSYKTYRDVWLTEGLAQFSILYYYKKTMSERKFNRVVRKLKRWVHRKTEAGPIIYGTRIRSLEDDFDAYQSIIYNKSALVLLTLMELIGEQEFLDRLQSVLEKYRYQSISSQQFIRQFSGENKMISAFFEKWIFSRKLPVIQMHLLDKDKEYDNKHHKKVVLLIKQLDTDFIFPFRLKVSTEKSDTLIRLEMKAKEQRYVISRDETIYSINLVNWIPLIREKKLPLSKR